MRRLILLAPSALVVVALAGGCGGSSYSQRGSTSAGATRLAAYARAVNIHTADVPGMTSYSYEGADLPRERLAPYGCGGGIVGTPETIHSTSFLAGFGNAVRANRQRPEAVFSTVQLLTSATVAREDVERDRVRSVEQCARRYLSAAAGQRGPLVADRASFASLSIPLPAPGFAFSATERERYKPAEPSKPPRTLGERLRDRTLGTTTDYLGFAHGRMIVTLFDTHSPEDAPRSQERRLLHLLYERATTNTL